MDRVEGMGGGWEKGRGKKLWPECKINKLIRKKIHVDTRLDVQFSYTHVHAHTHSLSFYILIGAISMVMRRYGKTRDSCFRLVFQQ